MEIKISERGTSCSLCGLYLDRLGLADGSGYRFRHPIDDCPNSGASASIAADGQTIPTPARLDREVLRIVEIVDGDGDVEGKFLVSSDVVDLQNHLDALLGDSDWWEARITRVTPMSLSDLDAEITKELLTDDDEDEE